MNDRKPLQQTVFSELDIHFGRFLERLSGALSPALFLAAALASHFRTLGHPCVDLAVATGKAYSSGDVVFPSPPQLPEWLKALAESSVVGKPGEFRPLILDGSLLYLCRYWNYEHDLAGFLTERAGLDVKGVDEGLLQNGLLRLFPERGKDGVSWTKVAAFTAVCKHLCVISGGPGTGKTSTVAAILALLLEQSGGKNLRIALTAPTGKAAARLLQALRDAKTTLRTSDAVKAALPDRSSTLHRLLGGLPHTSRSRYHAGRALPVDVLVIDEASMVDLALFTKLLRALPLHARLVLLGDRDQLASVEAGAVLGDICDTGFSHGYSRAFADRYGRITGEVIRPAPQKTSPLADTVATLRESFRFGIESGIGALSAAVKEGDSLAVLDLLKNNRHEDVSRRDLPQTGRLAAALESGVLSYFISGLTAADPSEAMAAFNRFRMLCALREGPYGAKAVNLLIEQLLRKKRLIRRNSPWYAGRPVMIVKNDYNLKLFNGDVGIALPDPDMNQALRVFFPAEENAFRSLPPLRLPEHETVFAMTVHKSQGSEFDHIHLILPDRDAPVLTRELLYTGITRARQSITFWGPEDVIRQAVARKTDRMSGLRDALWGKAL